MFKLILYLLRVNTLDNEQFHWINDIYIKFGNKKLKNMLGTA